MTGTKDWEEAFHQHFWPKYPRKSNKAYALRCFMRLERGESDLPGLLGWILDGLDHYITNEWSYLDLSKPDDRQKLPHASTWINQRRFEDVDRPA